MPSAMPAVVRLILGALTLFAIGWQLAIHVAAGFDVVNFFSYFTNLSNLVAAGVLLRFGALGLSGRAPSPVDEQLRGMAVVYMTVVGVVFALLLRHVDLGALRPWINVLLHYVMPVAVVADWLLRPGDAGSRGRLLVLAFPLVYVIYTLARGALVGWYPYPFLDPRRDGWASVGVHVVAIVVLFVLTQWAATAVARVLGRPAGPAAGEVSGRL